LVEKEREKNKVFLMDFFEDLFDFQHWFRKPGRGAAGKRGVG
jgi:hypothetical protein